MIVDKEATDSIIEAFLKQLIDRDDIGVILISQNVAERVR